MQNEIDKVREAAELFTTHITDLDRRIARLLERDCNIFVRSAERERQSMPSTLLIQILTSSYGQFPFGNSSLATMQGRSLMLGLRADP